MTFYIMAEAFYWIIWYYSLRTLLHTPHFHFLTLGSRSARLSILFTVIRITPPYTGKRRALQFLAWSFGVAWGILAAQLIWICEKQPAWKVRGTL